MRVHHVDDIDALHFGSRRDVIDRTVERTILVHRHLTRLKLKLATKSVLVASELAIATEAQALLAAQGIVIDTAAVGRDVGVLTAGGGKRVTYPRNPCAGVGDESSDD